jgi:hypothetical protein
MSSIGANVRRLDMLKKRTRDVIAVSLSGYFAG